MTLEPDHTGKCLCGEVKIEVSGDALWVGHCHCPSCQKALGGAFATYAGFKKENVRLTGDTLTVFRSSPGVTRRFCSKCGSAISFEGEAWPDELHIHVALMKDAALFEPEGHTYVRNRLPWVHMDDGLPTHDKFSQPHE